MAASGYATGGLRCVLYTRSGISGDYMRNYARGGACICIRAAYGADVH